MKENGTEALSEDFLLELYFSVFKYPTICCTISQFMKPEYLPDRAFQSLHKAVSSYYKANKSVPSYGVIIQKFVHDDDVTELINDIRDVNYQGTPESVLLTLEEYIKNVKLQQIYSEVGKLYNRGLQEKARDLLKEYSDWLSGFSLQGNGFVDVIPTFEERHAANVRAKAEMQRNQKPEVSRFYIDALDDLNAGRSLRGQVSCFLAATGVGKSHIARHIGKFAATADGLHVLHFQLEGAEKEITDAYSGSLIEKNPYWYEQGKIGTTEMRAYVTQLARYAGSIRVRSFPRFANRVSTLDIQSGIAEYRKLTGHNPDVVVVDSLDLLTDSSRRNWDSGEERHKRIAVANDLKDLANDEDLWMVCTYQATIENKDWLNDERNVLSEYNCAESKGISRPLTHLISLNQSDAERRRCELRIHVAKSRFFAKGDTFKIATRFDDEVFYDRQRTLLLMQPEL